MIFCYGSWVATFWERAAHSINRMFYCIMSICNFGCFPFGFEGGSVVLVASAPGHDLPFAAKLKN